MSKIIKYIIWLVIIAALGAGIFWLSRGDNNSTLAQNPIKIGVIGHFSGEYASYGIPMKNAAELAVEEFNRSKNEKERKIELIMEDDGTDALKAASAMNKLISADGTNYIISAQGSGATSAITPIAKSSNKILMITLGSAPDLTKAGGGIFRSVISDVYQGIEMANFVNTELNANRIAGLYVNDAYGVGVKNLIEGNIKSNLGTQEMFESGAADFKSQLSKIKDDKADVLILVSRKETPIILKQIKELGMNLKIIASETVKDEQILKESKDLAEGVWVVFTAEPQDFVGFAAKYEAKFGEKPSAYSMYAYDGTTALLKAIDQAGDDVEKVKNALANVSFNGASGNFKFDSDRERTGMKYVIYQVENNQFVPVGE